MKSAAAVFIVVISILACVQVAPAAAQDTTTSAEQQLADKYVPIADLRKQEADCDKDGEGYFPAPVEFVLGNPDVALKQMTGEDSESDTVVKMGPTAQDLAGKDDTYYLDFPGDPHHTGCDYETYFKQKSAEMGIVPTTYVHIFPDAESNQLFVEYWFYYYLNDWNNTHESDWEMITLVFDAQTVEEALTMDPVKVGFAQHGGGETADWGAEKLQFENGHIVVHPGAGSHGTYYNEKVYVGWGEGGTGFGCDNTTSPVVQTPLAAIVVPSDPDPNGPFGWALYGGRWGERQKSEWNGPKGPNLGKKWTDPTEAIADWRTSSLAVPGSNSTVGPDATDLFCQLSETGSKIVTRLAETPKLLISVFVGILLAIVALFFVKRQELGEAFGIYFHHLTTFVGIGLFTIPIGIVFNGFAILVRENPPMEWVVKWFNDTAAARLTAAAIVGGFQFVAMLIVISPPVIQAVKDLQEGQEIGVRRSFKRGYSHLGPVTVGILLIAAVLASLSLLLVLLPLLLWLAVRWQFTSQAIVLDDIPSGRQGMGSSWSAVKGRWWQALGDSVVFQIFAVIPGPLVGALLMIAGKASVEWVNVFSSVVYALTIPISIIGMTVAFRRYQRHQEVPAQPATGATLPEQAAPGVAPA